MNTHTPGPWSATDTCGIWDVFAHTEDSMLRLIGTGSSENAKANAKLIACAPDLLQLLKQCLNYIEHSEANRGKKSNAVEWEKNVAEFRKHTTRLGVGRAYVDSAVVNLEACRAVIARATGGVV